MARYKTFNQVNPGSFIFQINPFTLEIEDLPVIEVKGHPKYPKHLLISYKRIDKPIMDINPNHTETQDLLVEGNSTLVVTQTSIPVPICADKTYLREWMNK